MVTCLQLVTRLVAFVLCLWMSIGSVKALAQSVPPEVARANDSITAAKSFRIVTTTGDRSAEVDFIRPDRELVDMHPQKIIRIGNIVWAQVPPVGAWQVVGNAGPGKLANLVEIGLPDNPVTHREADASDGVSLAHVYAVDYPAIRMQLHWYIRVSDGRLHRIVGPSSTPGLDQVIVIDRYNAVDPINAPTVP
jgi:hypothetical protein